MPDVSAGLGPSLGTPAKRVVLDLTLDACDEEEPPAAPDPKRRKGGENFLGWCLPAKRTGGAAAQAAASGSGAMPPGFQPGSSAPPALRALLGSGFLPPGEEGCRALYAPLTSNGASWLWLLRGACRPGLGRFEGLWAKHPPELSRGKIFGKEVTFHRYQQAFGLDYAFSGQLAVATPMTQAAAPEVFFVKEQLRAWLQMGGPQFRGLSYEASLVNWYEGGGHWIGAHADDERGLVPGAPIFAVSWGEARTFRVQPKKNLPREGLLRAEVEVQDGDLIVMGGTCQKTHKHEVPKSARRPGRRISLTFRCFQAQQEAAGRAR